MTISRSPSSLSSILLVQSMILFKIIRNNMDIMVQEFIKERSSNEPYLRMHARRSEFIERRFKY